MRKQKLLLHRAQTSIAQVGLRKPRVIWVIQKSRGFPRQLPVCLLLPLIGGSQRATAVECATLAKRLSASLPQLVTEVEKEEEEEEEDLTRHGLRAFQNEAYTYTHAARSRLTRQLVSSNYRAVSVVESSSTVTSMLRIILRLESISKESLRGFLSKHDRAENLP